MIGCGCEGRRASEDESAAGAILYRLQQRVSGSTSGGDGSWISTSRPKKPLRGNTAARRLVCLGYERYLAFCLARNTVTVVPRLESGAFVGRRCRGVGRRA